MSQLLPGSFQVDYELKRAFIIAQIFGNAVIRQSDFQGVFKATTKFPPWAPPLADMFDPELDACVRVPGVEDIVALEYGGRKQQHES